MDRKCFTPGPDEKAHEVKPGETLRDITHHAIDECFGKPQSPAEWEQRNKDIAGELDAIVKRNGITNTNLLDSGNLDENLGPIKPAQTLQIPNPEKLYSQ